MVWEIELITHVKPTRRPAEFVGQLRTGGEFVIENSRYKTKLRNDHQVSIVYSGDQGSLTPR